MAKITFVYPDFESLGLAYLMSCCSKAGHDVDFKYYEAEDTYLGIRKGYISYDKIAEDIVSKNPNIVAFSCVTDNYQYQLECAKAIKRLKKDIYTIFGGIHITAVPDKVLKNDAVDAVALGEAECSLVEFLKESSLKGCFCFPSCPIHGIVFKKNGQIFGNFQEGRIADLDQLPFPYKKPFFSTLRDSLSEYRIITSRGCPYHCSYCFNSYIHKLRGRKILRRRSVSNVIAELLWAKKEFSPRFIMFVDDSFTVSKKWIKQFCNLYNIEINLPFGCVTNPSYIDNEMSEILASAGCVNVQLGIQSLSEEICDLILERKSKNIQIEAAIYNLRKNKIMVQVDHMLGIPGDTIKIQEESIRFYNNYRPNLISIFWLTYYPKTTILATAQKLGILQGHEIELIEDGKRITKESYLTGGSLKDPDPYYSISFLLNWLPLLPKWLVEFLIKSSLYRLLKVKNYYVSTVLPRVIQSIFNKQDFRGRSHIIRFIGKIFRKN